MSETLRIERLDRRGNGVARVSDRTVRLPMTLPGELVEATDSGVRVLEPSPDRVRPPCPHFRQCGGCALMHASDEVVAAWKRGLLESALAAQGLPAPIEGIHTSPPRSRRRAVLSGRRTKKGALVGFHARASDVIVDVVDCHVIRPEIQAALPLLRRIVAKGGSRSAEVTLTVIHGPAGLDVTATGGKPMDPALFSTLAALAAEGDLARLTWNGEAITRRPPALPIGPAQVIPPAGAFLQATVEGEAALLGCVDEFTQGARRIADLYAGIGTFTLPLSRRAEVHAVEGLSAPLAALDAGWRGAAGLRRVTTEIRDLARRPLLADELTGLDAIVIDPPRAGAEAQAREIAASAAPVVAFVACEPVGFARDARILCDNGYDLTRLFVIDQFRWAAHVEIAAEFRRR
ncbi:class I SAM-dependent RNA methyltransferase [Paracoccus sp. TK19116]|uniref:Class I SAM-dependent RNA methyltransferase n=1 Tax=Paracoccus albicereus TaxID=2922394 RepID=A0ABT1MU93_9RHOB|nr:class I SAM-dependent RNA methyltransferase [Paracoccus albicereus]MCQ0970893.1 class I SAM-dependent RNA methyltransferase [Paracoccus albicereus]